MKVTASIPMSKADLDRLTDSDLRWLEDEVSRRLKERLELEFGANSPESVGKNCPTEGTTKTNIKTVPLGKENARPVGGPPRPQPDAAAEPE